MNAPHRYIRASVIALAAITAGESSVAADKPPPVQWERFAGDQGFSISVPEGYTVDSRYRYRGLGDGRIIRGTSFEIAERMWKGSNLASDSYLSVEWIPGDGECRAALFLPEGAEVKKVTDRGVAYEVGTFGDAGAGNFYDQVVYAFLKAKRCTAVRYFIHSTNIGNYDPGAVEEFNRAALVAQWDKMRRSISFP